MEEKQVKHWLKENWFKLGVLVALIVLVSGVSLYLNEKNRLAEQERLDKITRAEEIKTAEEQSRFEQEQVQMLEQQKKEEQRKIANQIVATKNARIISQIIEFEDVLEGKLVDADINCSVLATYNNLAVVRPSELASALPGSKQTYEGKCSNSFSPLVFLENKLVAEPELQALRKILTDYIRDVKSLAVYALNGGYLASILDKYSVNFDNYRLSAREELLRLQRQYNVKSQYISQ